MGCFTGTITRTDSSWGGQLETSRSAWNGTAEYSSQPLLGTIHRVGQMCEGVASRIGAAWSGGSMSLVCVINKTPFIKVTPEMVWLTADTDWEGEFIVGSNTNWIIE